jgi:hypothetical protein
MVLHVQMVIIGNIAIRGGASPPKLGGQIEKKSFGGAKIRKNNKIWGNFLIFFFGENLGAWGGQAPPTPKVAPPLIAIVST